jgi:hypothetical protein
MHTSYKAPVDPNDPIAILDCLVGNLIRQSLD